ncbi:hypothetical protein [Yoonia sp.]|uniref:hypothetical protein n=1 Tax=Yoonia sp. TaxID=2212373 RepID=UPI003F6D7026
MPKMISVARIDTSKNADPAGGMTAYNDAFGQYGTNLAFALRPAALLRGLATRLSAPADPDDARACRDFVMEMTARNPDAFSSDLDVQAMMQHYP